MKTRRLLVSDIDGTLLDNGEATMGLDTLKALLHRHRDRISLVYATGRSFRSTWELVASGILPEPMAVASNVGTEVWLPGWQGPSPFYRELIRHDWNRDAVTLMAERVPGLVSQEKSFQTPFKVSFEVTPNAKIIDLTTLLKHRGIEARAVYSCGRFLDIIPKAAGKRAAVEFLSRIFDVPLKHVVTCGDSGNDLDMLMNPATYNVAVANAEAEVRRLSDYQLFYQAEKEYAQGVIEGTEAYDFWPRQSA